MEGSVLKDENEMIEMNVSVAHLRRDRSGEDVQLVHLFLRLECK